MATKTYDPVVRVSHLSKSYGNITALLDVSFDIYPGEILAKEAIKTGKNWTAASHILWMPMPKPESFWL
jgi:ABC-type phosphonate transport system ATPase subunit